MSKTASPSLRGATPGPQHRAGKARDTRTVERGDREDHSADLNHGRFTSGHGGSPTVRRNEPYGGKPQLVTTKTRLGAEVAAKTAARAGELSGHFSHGGSAIGAKATMTQTLGTRAGVEARVRADSLVVEEETYQWFKEMGLV